MKNIYPQSNEYWLEVEKNHNQDFAALKVILTNDRAALGIVAALLLSIDISAINTPVPNAGQGTLLFYLGFYSVSALSALVCVWLGMVQYLKINHLNAEAACSYKAAMLWYEEPIVFLNISLVTLPLGLILGIYLAQGLQTGWLSLILMSGLYVIGIVLAIISERKYANICKAANKREQGTLLPNLPN